MSNLKLSRNDLDWASREGLLTREQADALWIALEKRSAGSPRFDIAHVAYYAGAMVVISAMGWFINEAWEAFGGLGLTAVALAYAAAFAAAGKELWFRRNLKVPGGLLFTVAVSMTPLAIYGIERMTGIWPQGDPGTYADYYDWVRGSWLLMEVGTVAVGFLALRYVKFPFLTAPIAFALWFLSMDLTPLLFGGDDFSWEQRRQVSVWFGLAMLLATFAFDRRTREDYAFWCYLFGLVAFWGGLTASDTDSELAKFGYCLVNVLLMFLAVVLQRRTFMVFGGIGLFIYLSHLANEVFADSILFPFALSLIGILIILGGVKFQRNEKRIEAAVVGMMPDSLRRVLPTHRSPPVRDDDSRTPT